MKSFFVLFYAAICAATIVGFARCERAVSDAEDGRGSTADKPQQANRRSIGENHGLYEPSYHGHYAPHYHVHGLSAAPAHYHATAPDHYHLHTNSYAPGHYHFDHHDTAVHGYRHQPIVYQSVVNTYPTATTVVHKPVPVPVHVAHPVPVPVARPVPVEVPRPYPVPVNRPYPVTVVKPVPVPVAQPYPVAVYRPYPVPVYRPLVRPVAVRPHVAVRPYRPYPVQPVATSYVHSHRVYAPAHTHYAPPRTYGPHYHGAYPVATAPTSSYLQQLAAIRAVGGGGGGVEYDANDAVSAQQQTFPEDYSFVNEQQEADVNDGHYRHESAIGEDGGGYPSLATDETFKTGLGVPNTDYAGQKK